MKDIFVDIDGTLTNEIDGFSEEVYLARTPKQKMIDLINKLGVVHKITLYTARHEEDRAVTIQWLKDHGVEYDNLILGKPHYDILIDDKCISAQDCEVIANLLYLVGG